MRIAVTTISLLLRIGTLYTFFPKEDVIKIFFARKIEKEHRRLRAYIGVSHTFN